MSGEGVVAVGEGIELGLHGVSVEGIEHDSLVHLSVTVDSLSASDDGGGTGDIVEDGGVDGLEGSGSGSHLTGVVDGSLGDDGAVGNNEARPLELGFEVLDDNGGDLVVGNEGSEGDSDEDVGGLGLVNGGVLNGVDGVNEDAGELGTLTLEGGEGLGDLLVELGELLALSLDDLGFVEHLFGV